VLHAGRKLTAPPSLVGRWDVDAQGQLGSALACRPSNPSGERWALDVTQSGPRLTMVIANHVELPLRGSVESNVVHASGRHSGAPTLQLNADLTPGAPVETMTGAVKTDCPSAADRHVEIRFRATRVKQAPKEHG
jgi:hypothetical protein